MNKNLMTRSDFVNDFVRDMRNTLIGYDLPWKDIPTFTQVYDNYPPDNIYHSEYTTVIVLAVAGFNKDNIKVERSDNKLVISGSKEEKEEEEGKNYSRRNIAARSFTKTYPVSNDFKDIEATLNDGMLRVVLKKDIKTVDVKQIEVK